MDSKNVLPAVEAMNKDSPARKFSQTVELIITFKGLDFKKVENQIDLKVAVPHSAGSTKGKTLVFCRTEAFANICKGIADRVILENEIENIDKKSVNQLMAEFDTLLAEGPVMLTVGRFLGQQLAPRGKMPRPVNADEKSLRSAVEGLTNFVRVSNKRAKSPPMVQMVIGNEKMQPQQLAENVAAVVGAVSDKLPSKGFNIKHVLIKKAMGPVFKVEGFQ
jgi:large subunit ribosomal protein L1